MDDMIYDANVYSAFLEGKATQEENYAILERMMHEPRLVMELNLAAAGNIYSSNKTR